MINFLLGFFTCLLINSFIKARRRSEAIEMLNEILKDFDHDDLEDGNVLFIKKDSQN